MGAGGIMDNEIINLVIRPEIDEEAFKNVNKRLKLLINNHNTLHFAIQITLIIYASIILFVIALLLYGGCT